jgi:hypothetical protein
MGVVWKAWQTDLKRYVAVKILLGNGDGTFRTGSIIAVGIDPSGLVVGDFNGDGRPDLVIADAGSDDVEVLLGLGDATFSNAIILQVGINTNYNILLLACHLQASHQRVLMSNVTCEIYATYLVVLAM